MRNKNGVLVVNKSIKNRLEYRFSWVPICGFIIAALGFILGGISKEFGFFTIATGIVVFVLGNILIVFFPKKEHKNKFKASSKILVVGFFLVALSTALNAMHHSKELVNAIYIIGLGLFVLGMFSSSNKRRN